MVHGSRWYMDQEPTEGPGVFRSCCSLEAENRPSGHASKTVARAWVD